MKPILEVENLRVDFLLGKRSVQAVRGVSWSLAHGECLGIVGESGSGKSVSVLAALGLLGSRVKTSGRVQFDGQDLDLLSPRELRKFRGPKFAMIFQEPSRSFDPIYNIEKTFFETFKVHDPRIDRGRSRERALKLLHEVHIDEPERRLASYPHQFSGGMLQRVMIALALANDPQVLVCDEPTTALDVTIQAQIMALLRELKTSRKLSLVFISHDLDLVVGIADRILVMYGGLVLETAPARGLFAHPVSPYSQALLGARLFNGQRWENHPLALIPGSPPDPANPEPGCPFAPRCGRALSDCRTAIPALLANGPEASYRCLYPVGLS